MRRTVTATTRRPLAYATGGAMEQQAVQIDRCTAAHPDLDAYLAGGPIDAPGCIPTGQIVRSHGVRFFVFSYRED